MKHVVFIVGSYFPNYSAVGKCMGNIADELSKENKITVICEKTNLNQPDTDLFGSQKIIRVTTKRKERYLTNGQNQSQNNSLVQSLKNKYYTFERFVFRTFANTSIDKKMVEAYEKALKQITDKIDVIIPTCSPFESVVAACNYKKYDESIEIIPYLFDLFADNNNLNYFESIKKIKWGHNINLEKDAFNCSKKILHVDNWSLHISNHLSEYIDKSILVEHPLLIPNKHQNYNNLNVKEFGAKDDKLSNLYSGEEKYNLVFAGALRKGYVDASYAIKLFSDGSLKNVEVSFYSSGNGTMDVANCTKSNIHLKSWVPREELEKIYVEADAFISIAEKNGKQLSSKIFDYMSHQKPIIHFYYTDQDINIKYLKSYKNALLVKVSNDFKYNTGIVNDFLNSRVNMYDDTYRFDDLLIKCTPEYITGIIKQYI